MPTLQFHLPDARLDEAYEAMSKTSASNLNMLAKMVFLDYLDKQGQATQQLEMVNAKLDDVLLSNQAIAQLLNDADFQMMYRIMGAIFMLTHGAVPANIKKRVDDVFNSDAIIDFMAGKD